MSNKHRRHVNTSELYEHRPDTATVVRTSTDGRRAQQESVPVQRGATRPAHFYEDLATNSALDAQDFGYEMGDDSLRPEEEGPEDDGINVRVKAKRYQNSDLPFLTWVDYRDDYLDEMLRLEGRGDASVYSTCVSCQAADPIYRCENQSCHGMGLFCKTCIVAGHEVLPTHWIQWNGSFFKRVGLADLGLVVQLGHTAGSACSASRAARKKFTVIDLLRVCWWPATVLNPSMCATFGVIRLFHNVNSLGKVSGFHFLRSLELLTNNDGLEPPPNRRRAFMFIVRQYHMMLMMKRAGRAYTDSGVGGTEQGELALPCRACPQPGKNLPEGWDKINWDAMPEDLRYKYFLFLAQDCNFRLINRDISTEARDPVIDNGLGYFCNRALYKTFLRDHVDEEEISTCSGFQVMFLANTKRVKGLRTTGVGGVTCARHNMWRANGISDLQNGERYCNMDFILFSAVLNMIMLYIILSYDIACQYSKKFWTRMTGLPSAMYIDPAKVAFWFKVPNFHMLGHRWPCHSPFSFHWMWGVGMTDGEDVEQNWEFTNGAAGSSKMMGLGARHAFLESLFSFHNWMRTVSYRKVFSQRMVRDLKEAKKHKDAFNAFTTLLEGDQPELVAKWRGWVKDWESEQHTEGIDSPYETSKPVHTMKDICLRLGKEELTRTGAGVQIERQHTSSTFITMGLEIEHSQRILTIDMKALKDPTELQELDFVKRKTALLKRITRFQKLQSTYMPDLARFLTASQRVIWEDKTRSAEAVKLFMPSELGEESRRQACENGLAEIEEEMREGEVQETLEELRQGLRVRTMTSRFRHRNNTGQRALTRGQGVLRQVSVRIHKAKLRYRYAWNALLRLRGHGAWEKTYRALAEEDVRGVNERAASEEEEAEREKLRELGAIVEGGIAAAGVVAAGEGMHTMSWIWYNTNLATGEADLVEALRVEWCKAYSRTRRWHEDIVLVDEEMRCTIEFGAFMAGTWWLRATARTERVSPELEEGLRAYAMEHVDREERTCVRLSVQWRGLREKARMYLAGVAEPREEREEREEVLTVDIEEETSDVEGEDNVDGLDEEEDDTDDED
ncbi:hypothetical protein FB451DRAFT_1343526 [Mycena latifolia]|nr:hypothetical protein FB451DRAFT_1343526 [Mycena latifolia]